jgi:phosphatidylethanolamine-binding protein (PEBP) family uncharacterized protein
MTFTVATNSFKDGDYLPSDFILSSDFGFGCAGRNRSPHLKWSDAPGSQTPRLRSIKRKFSDDVTW